MADINNEVLQVVEDLKLKIDKLNKAQDGVGGETLIKIKEVADKAIAILSEASNKILEIAEEGAEPEEIMQGLDVIKNKSKVLFENGMDRISEIKKASSVDKTNDTNKQIDDYFVEAQKEPQRKFVSENQTELDKVVVNILREWLKPEEK